MALWFGAASFSHFLNVAQGRKLLPSDSLDRKAPATYFASQAGNRHASIGEGDFDGRLESQWRVVGNRAWIGQLGHLGNYSVAVCTPPLLRARLFVYPPGSCC